MSPWFLIGCNSCIPATACISLTKVRRWFLAKLSTSQHPRNNSQVVRVRNCWIMSTSSLPAPQLDSLSSVVHRSPESIQRTKCYLSHQKPTHEPTCHSLSSLSPSPSLSFLLPHSASQNLILNKLIFSQSLHGGNPDQKISFIAVSS